MERELRWLYHDDGKPARVRGRTEHRVALAHVHRHQRHRPGLEDRQHRSLSARGLSSWFTHTNGDSNSYIHGYIHTHADSYRYIHAYSHSECYVYANTYSNGYSYCDANAHVRRIHDQSDRGQHCARHYRHRQSRR